MGDKIKHPPGEDLERNAEEPGRHATYDYQPIVSAILDGGGSVCICNLRTGSAFGPVCPHCDEVLPTDKKHLACPYCKKGIKYGTKFRRIKKVSDD
jgi:hypothetical protein